MRLFLSLLLSFNFLVLPASTQVKTPKFDGRTILEYIKVLADDSMEGRKSGLPGGDKGASYIAGKFKEWNIKPAGENGSFFQKFFLEDCFDVEPGASLEIYNHGDRRAFYFEQELYDTWRVMDLSGSGAFEAELVFVGYGIHAPDQGYDDYAGVDIKGKIALASSGRSKALSEKVGPQSVHSERIKAAQKLGAKGMIFFPEPKPIRESIRSRPFPAYVHLTKDIHDPDFVVVGISDVIAAYIFKYLPVDIRHPFSEIESGGKPQSFLTGVRAKVNVRTTLEEKREASNVLAKLDGSDPGLKNEYVVLGAHMDGLGISPRGEVLNGANDNASGTAVVMDVARAMVVNKVKPKRTIVFALWAAEEQGLLGSKHYAADPVYPLDKTVANINLDMVGQGGGKIGLGGIYLSSEIWDILKGKIDKDIMEGIWPRRGVGGSDHLPFLAEGVPAFHMVGNRPHFKSHQPHDDWDLIKPDMLEKAGRFLYQASLLLANADSDIFYPKRAEKILFRKTNIINFRVLPYSFVLENMKDVKDPDVDMQLVFLEEMENAISSERKVSLLEALNSLPQDLKKTPGLSVYQSDPRAARTGGSGQTKLVVGFRGSASFKDNPAWLNIFSKSGLHFIWLEKDDIELEENTLTPETQEMIKAADESKLLLILSGLDDVRQIEVMKTSHNPMIFVSPDLPSQESLDLMCQRGHVLALIYQAGDDSLSYFNKLKSAEDKLSSSQLIAWNDSSLWEKAGAAAHLNLFSHFIGANWNREDRSRQSKMSDVLSYSFLNALMRFSR